MCERDRKKRGKREIWCVFLKPETENSVKHHFFLIKKKLRELFYTPHTDSISSQEVGSVSRVQILVAFIFMYMPFREA